jgi:galactose mutarotase-like enzyme
MAIHIIKNNQLTLEINDLGAEMTSISDQNTGIPYLWNGDPNYWKRHAPILFPFVGSLKDKTYSYQGQTYSSVQHGFARDLEFEVLSKAEDEIWFRLDATEETKKLYPFDFRLELGYHLAGRKITCTWRVENLGTSAMYFSIGGHPAFNCPLDPSKEQTEYYFSFDTDYAIHYLLIDENGNVNKKPHTLITDNGILPVEPHMFDYDALIIEDQQCHKVSLLDSDKNPYLTVSFDAPLFGLWSPAKKNAPFVCIEPWYGRCDASDFTGTLEEREYGNSLDSGKVFEVNYSIEIM